MLYVALFIICAAFIFFAGKKLSYYGEAIARLTGWDKAWIGLVMMATITSLPELMTGISSSAIVKSANLAVGDVFGSCAFNLCLLAMLDAFTPNHKPILGSSSTNHVLAAALGLILVTMAGLSIFLDGDIVLIPSIGITSVTFLIIYLVSIHLLYRQNKMQSATNDEPHEKPNPAALTSAWKGYLTYATIIVAAALALPWLADHISQISGLGPSFTATLFLAISTSLPEIAVSIAAVRTGAIDIAVGNLLGSNIFNILILFIDDVFYTTGHLLKDADDSNLVSVFSVILMSAIAIIGLTIKLPGKRFILAYDALLIAIVYVINLVLLYHLTT